VDHGAGKLVPAPAREIGSVNADEFVEAVRGEEETPRRIGLPQKANGSALGSLSRGLRAGVGDPRLARRSLVSVRIARHCPAPFREIRPTLCLTRR
jgi:hypothetical protein